MANKNKFLSLFNIIVSLSLMLFFRYLPAPAPLTPFGMTVGGIFLGAIWGWCTSGLIWPSCVAITLIGFTGYMSVNAAWGAAWGHSLVLFIIFFFILAELLRQTGVTELLAKWVVSRKISQGRPWVLVILVFLATLLTGAVISNLAATVLYWSIWEDIFKEVGYKKGDKFPAVAMFGTVYIAIMGITALPFQISVLTGFGFLFAGSGGALTSFDYLQYFSYAIFYSFTALIAFTLICKYIFRPDVSLLKNYVPKPYEGTGMNKKQKMAVVLFAVIVLLLMSPSFLPKGLLLNVINTLGNTGILALAIALMLVLKVDGDPFADLPQLISKGVSWGLIFMLGAAMMMAGAITSKDAGIVAFFSGKLDPIFAHGGFTFVVLFLLITIIVTNFVNNVAVASVLCPMAYIFCMKFGLNPLALVAVFVFLVDYAIMLPSASPAGAFVHSCEYISKKQIYSWGFWTLLLQFLIAIVIAWPLANFFMKMPM